MIHCDLHKDCKNAHMPYTNGYFSPSDVGEHCHHFAQIEFSEPDVAEKLASLAGAHQ